MSEKILQTAGRDQLGKFAPMFAHLNDDVLCFRTLQSRLPVKRRAMNGWKPCQMKTMAN